MWGHFAARDRGRVARGARARRFLIVVAVVVALVAAACNVYVLVHFQHPDDRNQAWFPKIVVVTGLTIAVLSILLLPLDVGNRTACAEAIIESACRYTMPMTELWYATYLTMFSYIFVLIPWTLFYYEQDHDTPLGKRIVSSSLWSLLSTVVLLLIMLIVYYFGGEAEFQLKSVSSGIMLLGNAALNNASSCIAIPSTLTSATNFLTTSGSLGGMKCSALRADVATETFKVKPTFIIYVIAVCSIVSWLIFMIYAGVGVVAMPIDLIRSFLTRPTKVISKSEYIRCATILVRDVQNVRTEIKNLQKEQATSGKTRKVKKQMIELQEKLMKLEDDELELQKVFPQGETRESMWMLSVLGYWLQLFLGIVCSGLSVLWVVHIVLYILIKPPPSTFLNAFFQYLDKVWSLLGTIFFAIFCFYLIFCVIKGNTRLGLKFLLVSLYPMKLGRTSMSSLLFNTGLIMLASVSVIQFCAQAFSAYSTETAVSKIFVGNIENLKGLGYLFKYNIFIYSFFAMICLSLIIVPFQTYRTAKPKKALDVV